MSYLFQDPKFWLLISFITFVTLMIKPFKSMMIGGIDSKIEEIKLNINNSLETYNKQKKNSKMQKNKLEIYLIKWMTLYLTQGHKLSLFLKIL